MIATDIETWVFVFMVLGYFSQLIKDNPWFRVVENTFVAITAANFMVVAYWNLRGMVGPNLMKGDLAMVLALIIGLLVLLRINPETRWLSNWPIGLLLAVQIGLAARGAIRSNIILWLTSAIGRFQNITSAFNLINTIIIMVGMLCALIYFTYTIKPFDALEKASKLGRWFIMAMYGNTTAWYWMSRTSLLISQTQVLLWDWLGLI
jgi:hypothetical protein